ncbi:MAG: type II toxin-antitoxin system RelE/ParE family toxin [Cyanobacteria bacterium J06648_16]
MQQLGDNPRPADATKLKGTENEYRIRVGSYRVRYEIFDEAVVVKLLRCAHSRDVYKDKS